MTFSFSKSLQKLRKTFYAPQNKISTMSLANDDIDSNSEEKK